MGTVKKAGQEVDQEEITHRESNLAGPCNDGLSYEELQARKREVAAARLVATPARETPLTDADHRAAIARAKAAHLAQQGAVGGKGSGKGRRAPVAAPVAAANPAPVTPPAANPPPPAVPPVSTPVPDPPTGTKNPWD